MSAPWHPEDVLEPRFRWSFPETQLMAQDLADAALGRGIGKRMTGLLARRGVTDAAGLDAWFADPWTACTTHASCRMPIERSLAWPWLASAPSGSWSSVTSTPTASTASRSSSWRCGATA